MTIQLPTHELHRILSEAAHFAGTDATLPTINAVQIEMDGTNLRAIGTNRFVLGVSRVKLAQPEEGEGRDPFAVMIPLAKAKRVIALAKTTKRDYHMRYVAVRFEDGKVSFSFDTDESIAVAPVDSVGVFPDWRRLFSITKGEASQAAARGYDARYLARFAKVSGAHNMQVFTPDTLAPTQVLIEDHFAGLIMPVRLAAAAVFEAPDWLGIAKAAKNG